MTEAVVRIAGATVARDGRVVLEDIRFDVAPGAFVGVIGPNGAGKTTLLRAILGLVPLATGRIDVAFDPVMAVWDNAPLLVVVEEAGGRFTDLGGERTIRGRGALATNGRLHEEVWAMIRDGGARGG